MRITPFQVNRAGQRLQAVFYFRVLLSQLNLNITQVAAIS